MAKKLAKWLVKMVVNSFLCVAIAVIVDIIFDYLGLQSLQPETRNSLNFLCYFIFAFVIFSIMDKVWKRVWK